MPPYNTWKNVTHVKPSSDDKTIRIINYILDEIYSDSQLRNEIDSFLNNSSKISAIKTIKIHFERHHKSRKYNLRNFKDAIDEYGRRLSIHNKLTKLLKRIEKWLDRNGYDKIGLQNKVTGDDGATIYKYSDWEMIDDHIGFMVNDRKWVPCSKQLKDYNELWKQYK